MGWRQILYNAMCIDQESDHVGLICGMGVCSGGKWEAGRASDYSSISTNIPRHDCETPGAGNLGRRFSSVLFPKEAQEVKEQQA